MIYTIEEYEMIKTKQYFRITNNIWNKTHINDPKEIGYLISIIDKVQPSTFEEWGIYFEKNIINSEVLASKALFFREFIKTSDIEDKANWEKVDFNLMIMCRLCYETYIGYLGEKLASREILNNLKNNYSKVELIKTSSSVDFNFAIDYELKVNDVKVCGIQVKPSTYSYSSKTHLLNIQKNKKYTEKEGLKVVYVKYNRSENYSLDKECLLTLNQTIMEVISI